MVRTTALSARPPASEDLYLVRSVLRGDAGAREELARRLSCIRGILRGLSRRGSGILQEADLDDLTQEVAAAVWHKLDRYHGEAPLERWVFRFCNYQFLRLRERGRRRRRIFDSVKRDLVSSLTASDDPSPVRYEHVYRGLERMPPAEELAVRKKCLLGMTFDEIGTDEQESTNTIKARYYRGLDRLRRFLASSVGEGEGAG